MGYQVTCTRCQGAGQESNNVGVNCGGCNGRGWRVENSGPGEEVPYEQCTRCQGVGQEPNNVGVNCGGCNGRGSIFDQNYSNSNSSSSGSATESGGQPEMGHSHVSSGEGMSSQSMGTGCVVIILLGPLVYLHSEFGLMGSIPFSILLIVWADWRFFGKGMRQDEWDKQPWGWALAFWVVLAIGAYNQVGWIGIIPPVILGLAHAKWRG